MSRRRVEADAAVYKHLTDKQRKAEGVAARAARKVDVELRAFDDVLQRRELSVRIARGRLLRATFSEPEIVTGGSSSSRRPRTSEAPVGPRVTTEAIREVTRDCVRRDDLERRKASAIRDFELASARAEALRLKRKEQVARLEAKKQEEEAWLARKLQFEHSRLAHSASVDSARLEGRHELSTFREKQKKKLQEEHDAHVKAKEEAKEEKKAKAERKEMEREAAIEERRKEKREIAKRVSANKAAEQARKAEGVWHEAEAAAGRCQAELEAEETMVEAMWYHAEAEGKDPSLLSSALQNLDRLRRRLEREQMKAQAARQALDEHLAHAKMKSAGGGAAKKSG